MYHQNAESALNASCLEPVVMEISCHYIIDHWNSNSLTGPLYLVLEHDKKTWTYQWITPAIQIHNLLK